METPQNSMKIVELTQVSPSISAADHQKSLNLTFFDLIWLKFHPVERLFFYEFTGNSYAQILHRLKHSLSLTLSHHLPLAGHLTWGPRDPKPYIHFSPTDSVSVVVAESSAGNFNKLSSKGNIINAIELRSYAPSLHITDEAATIISVQITFFPGSGFCIGIAAHHAILDGKSSIMFMKSWAHLCANFDQENENPPLLPAHLTPCFDRTVINDPTGKLEMLYLNNWLKSAAKINPEANPQSLKTLEMGEAIGEDHVRATFDLSRQDITKIREKILSKLNSNDDLHLSSFAITYAYAIVCFVKAEHLETNVKVHFLFTADFRSRLIPPVPANYFGNCVTCDKPSAIEAKDVVGEEGLVFVAKCISDSIKNLGKYGFFERAEEVLDSFSKTEPSPFGMIALAGSPKLEVYGVDFGWGRPKKVDVVSIDKTTTSISMAESGDQSGGIEIGLVTKTKVELQAFASLFVNSLK